MKRIIFTVIAFILASNSLFSQSNEKWHSLFATAYFDNISYDFIQKMCDVTANRLAGTEGNLKALEMLKEELRGLGYEPQVQAFNMPGWTRGDDKVIVKVPFERNLRAAALGYVQKAAPFTAELISITSADEEVISKADLKGKIALFTTPKDSRGNLLELAAKYGAIATLFINEKNGGLLLTGVANFAGKPTSIPGYSITYEEGHWLRRLVENGEKVELYIETNSFCIPQIESYNVYATLPGQVPQKILFGGHIDAWDLGNGGVDNAYGTAIVLELARIMKQYSPNNYYTIEFAWFNAEELGLWGSKAYAQSPLSKDVVAMFNFDMTGRPTGFNTMGFDDFIPFFEEIVSGFNGFELPRGVTSNPWSNSDHIFFMLEGIPSFTLHAHLDKDMYYYYHDFSDTFDKASKTMLSDAAAFSAVLAYEMANRRDLPYNRIKKSDVPSFFEQIKLKDQLIRQGWWELDK
jgi:carboxypeptidase Q